MALNHNVLHRDGSKKVYESPAISGQYLYFTSSGDDIQNKIIGKGEKFFIENIEALNEKIIYAQFLEDIQLKDAYIFWENAVWGDSISIEVELPANTPLETEYGNARIIDGVPTYITSSQTPDKTWTGTHLLSPVDIVLVRFVNSLLIHGSNTVGTVLESTGVAKIKKELKLKMRFNSETNNSNIKISLMAELYRTKTI